MNIWSQIFAEEFGIIFKVCVRTDRGRGGSAVDRGTGANVDRGKDAQKSLKMCEHPLWLAPKTQ